MSKKPKTYKRPGNTRAKRFVSKERVQRQKLYDKEWSNYRFRFLHHNPLCYCCPEKSTVIDHVIPHKGDIKLFWNAGNYIPLCRTCHNIITGSFDRHGQHLVEEKLRWIKSQRDKNKIVRAVKYVERK